MEPRPDESSKMFSANGVAMRGGCMQREKIAACVTRSQHMFADDVRESGEGEKPRFDPIASL